MVETLIKRCDNAKIDINEPLPNLDPLLNLATREGHDKIVEILLAYGIDVNSYFGGTALTERQERAIPRL